MVLEKRQQSTVNGQRSTVNGKSRFEGCSLSTAHCPLSTAHCPLSSVHCPLAAQHSLQPTTPYLFEQGVLRIGVRRVSARGAPQHGERVPAGGVGVGIAEHPGPIGHPLLPR